MSPTAQHERSKWTAERVLEYRGSNGHGVWEVLRVLTVGDDAGHEAEAVGDVHLRPPRVALAPEAQHRPLLHRAVPLPAGHHLANRVCSSRSSQTVRKHHHNPTRRSSSKARGSQRLTGYRGEHGGERGEEIVGHGDSSADGGDGEERHERGAARSCRQRHLGRLVSWPLSIFWSWRILCSVRRPATTSSVCGRLRLKRERLRQLVGRRGGVFMARRPPGID
jgi:hypothetical protein